MLTRRTFFQWCVACLAALGWGRKAEAKRAFTATGHPIPTPDNYRPPRVEIEFGLQPPIRGQTATYTIYDEWDKPPGIDYWLRKG